MSNKNLRWLAIASLGIVTMIQGCVSPGFSPAELQATARARPSITLLFTRTPFRFPTRTPTPNDGLAHIAIGDNFFDPAEVTIKVGTIVEWWHSGNGTHSITSLQGKWAPIFPAFGSRSRVNFDTPGVYLYVCSYHAGMGGSIKVEN